MEKTCEHHVNARVISSTEERERHCSDVELREKQFALVADTKFGTECAQKRRKRKSGHIRARGILGPPDLPRRWPERALGRISLWSLRDNILFARSPENGRHLLKRTPADAIY